MNKKMNKALIYVFCSPRNSYLNIITYLEPEMLSCLPPRIFIRVKNELELSKRLAIVEPFWVFWLSKLFWRSILAPLVICRGQLSSWNGVRFGLVKFWSSRSLWLLPPLVSYARFSALPNLTLRVILKIGKLSIWTALEFDALDINRITYQILFSILPFDDAEYREGKNHNYQ